MTLKLCPVQHEDVPRLLSIYFISFQNPHALACFARSLSVRKWFEDSFYTELEDPSCTFLKVVDESVAFEDQNAETHHSIAGGTELEDPRIIAWAKWSAPKDGVEPSTDSPVWPEGADIAVCEETFGAWARERVEIMGSRGHWYLQLLATDPEHQRRGAGGLLVKWGVEQADRDGREAYLEAAPEGLALYKKVGFEEAAALETIIQSPRVNHGTPTIYRNAFMLRKPR